MTIDIPAMLPTFVQIGLLMALLVLSVRLIRKSGRILTAVFLAFVYSLWLFTDLYWVIYDFMRPDRRMPFAVNEIGEAAVFLMLAAILSSAVPVRLSSSKKYAAGAILFASCNAALWIAWSGEWVQDILIGAVFTYFICNTVCALKSRKLLTKKEWIGLGGGCALLILAQSITFFVEPGVKSALETGCYLFLTAGAIYWVSKLIAARRRRASPKAALCLVFAFMSWLVTAKYMSDGLWYTAFMAAETAALALLYLSVKKVVAEA